MVRRVHLASPIFFLLACALWASSQSVGPAATSPPLEHRLTAIQPTGISLGQSLVPLYGPWKFQVGDSPADPATGKPLWAEPAFDDSRWESVDLTPADEASRGVVSGWGNRGHQGYSGYAWYRIRVAVHSAAGTDLALAGPANFDDAYQVFLNGRFLGEFGQFNGKQPKFFYSEPAAFSLTQTEHAGSQQNAVSDTEEVIAFRFWMAPATLLNIPDPGGFHTPPLLGTAEAVGAAYELGWVHLAKENAVWALTAVVYSALAAIAFALFFFNRGDRVYLWMAASFFAQAMGGAETAFSSWTQAITATTEQWICFVLVVPAIRFLWFMLLRDWFRVERPRWLPWAVGALALAMAAGYAGQFALLYPLVPASFISTFYVLEQCATLAYGLLMLWLTIRYVLGHGVESWLLVLALLSDWVSWLARGLTFLHVPRVFYPFGIFLSFAQITGFLMAVAMCGLLVRRWILSAHAQRVLAQELKQAHEVQQVLIPEAIPAIPGYAIQSVYQPAGQVGGDFFQILPAKDGGVLVCIGDVSGKGMPAAMTVSLLVGTLRTLAHYSESPAEILAAMNQRMLGRSRGGFTTCLVLVAAPDGTVTVANAGHIPPYLNGKELTIESGIPLGIAAGAEYPEAIFHQKENDRIALMTDGVVEARAASGELFGFERTAAIAHLSAEKVAQTAREFGQDDDITVLTLVRLATGETAPAPQIVASLSPSVA